MPDGIEDEFANMSDEEVLAAAREMEQFYLAAMQNGEVGVTEEMIVEVRAKRAKLEQSIAAEKIALRNARLATGAMEASADRLLAAVNANPNPKDRGN